MHRIKTFHNPKENVKQKKSRGLCLNLKGNETSYVNNKTGQAFSLQGCAMDSTLKPSISSHSRPHTMPRMMPRMRLLKCFVLITLCCKTKQLRSLVQAIVRGFE